MKNKTVRERQSRRRGLAVVGLLSILQIGCTGFFPSIRIDDSGLPDGELKAPLRRSFFNGEDAVTRAVNRYVKLSGIADLPDPAPRLQVAGCTCEADRKVCTYRGNATYVLSNFNNFGPARNRGLVWIDIRFDWATGTLAVNPTVSTFAQ